MSLNICDFIYFCMLVLSVICTFNYSNEQKTETKDADEDADERENLIQAYNASQLALEESASKIAVSIY